MTEEKRIKIVLIGESGVGKTNLISVAMGNPFQKDIEPTISSSYYEGNIIVNNKQYNYSLWDTAGQEAYRSLNKMFINGSKIILVVFAINNRESFKEVDFWVNYGQKKIVLKVPDLKVMNDALEKCKAAKIQYCMITDAGCTQIPPGSKTVLGIGPDTSEKINKITGTFKLMH